MDKGGRIGAIQGVVLKLGERPVEVAALAGADAPRVPAMPVEAELRVTDVRTLEVVAVARSAADGRFRIELPPGPYELQVVDAGEAAGPPVHVEAARDAMADVCVYFDTGVR